MKCNLELANRGEGRRGPGPRAPVAMRAAPRMTTRMRSISRRTRPHSRDDGRRVRSDPRHGEIEQSATPTSATRMWESFPPKHRRDLTCVPSCRMRRSTPMKAAVIERDGVPSATRRSCDTFRRRLPGRTRSWYDFVPLR